MNEASLLPGALEDSRGVGELRAVNEAEPDAVRATGHGYDGVRGALRGRIADDEEVVVVVRELVRTREALAQSLAHRADHALVLRRELGDELREPRLGDAGRLFRR